MAEDFTLYPILNTSSDQRLTVCQCESVISEIAIASVKDTKSEKTPASLRSSLFPSDSRQWPHRNQCRYITPSPYSDKHTKHFRKRRFPHRSKRRYHSPQTHARTPRTRTRKVHLVPRLTQQLISDPPPTRKPVRCIRCPSPREQEVNHRT